MIFNCHVFESPAVSNSPSTSKAFDITSSRHLNFRRRCTIWTFWPTPGRHPTFLQTQVSTQQPPFWICIPIPVHICTHICIPIPFRTLIQIPQWTWGLHRHLHALYCPCSSPCVLTNTACLKASPPPLLARLFPFNSSYPRHWPICTCLWKLELPSDLCLCACLSRLCRHGSSKQVS